MVYNLCMGKVYDVTDSRDAIPYARAQGSPVIIRLSGDLFYLSADGAVRPLDERRRAEAERMIALREYDVVRL